MARNLISSAAHFPVRAAGHLRWMYWHGRVEVQRVGGVRLRSLPRLVRLGMACARRACGRDRAIVGVNGVRLVVDLRCEWSGRFLYIYRFYEVAETKFLARVLKPGMTFCDVGANLGYFTSLGAKMVGSQGRVLAVEPCAQTYELLTKNVALNSLANVNAVQTALGSEADGEACLFHSATNSGDHRLYDTTNSRQSQERVRVTTLDRLAASFDCPPFDVIKIDVQGFERRVQVGMMEQLRRAKRQIVLTEFWPQGIVCAGDSPELYFQTFVDEGFQAFVLDEDGEKKATTFQDVMAKLWRREREGDVEPYTNLVFQKA
jgi:FkbM family methyltransferase